MNKFKNKRPTTGLRKAIDHLIDGLSAYLDVQNVYGRRNVTAYRWDPRSQAVQGDETIGVLPSIGVNLEF